MDAFKTTVNIVDSIKQALVMRHGEKADKLKAAQDNFNNFKTAVPGKIADIVEELEIEKAIVEEQFAIASKDAYPSKAVIDKAALEVRKATRKFKDAVEMTISVCTTEMAKAATKGDLVTFTNLYTLVGELSEGQFEGKISIANPLRAVKAAEERLEDLTNRKDPDLVRYENQLKNLQLQIDAANRVANLF